MTVREVNRNEKSVNDVPEYEYVPPEGGWGYVVVLSMSLFLIVTVVPLAAFGIVFGKFLANLGDETSYTSLVMSIFNTISSITGLAVNRMLQSMTCRRVGLLGAFLFFVGSFATIFVTNLMQMIISFGIIQGVGFGFMLPVTFSTFNNYFDKKKNVLMGISQAIVVAVTMVSPAIIKSLMDYYGFRGTVALISALSLNCFVAMATLQPVEWHMKKVKIEPNYDADEKINLGLDHKLNEKLTDVEEQRPFICRNECEKEKCNCSEQKQRPSLVSIGSIALSVGENLHKIHKDANKSKWSAIAEALDLDLFKDPVYVNISFGLSFSLMSDLTFLSIMPLLLTSYGFTMAELTQILTIYFASDLVCRILLSVVSAIVVVRNRYLFLAGSILSAIFRTAFVLDSSYTYTVCISAVLGFLRCLIQTPLPLVVAEEYPQRFPTAFSLYMVVCGIIMLLFGVLIGFVKSATQSNIAVVHLLTLAYLLCGIPWTIELIVSKLSKKKSEKRAAPVS